jgi:hypothetical protein
MDAELSGVGSKKSAESGNFAIAETSIAVSDRYAFNFPDANNPTQTNGNTYERSAAVPLA